MAAFQSASRVARVTAAKTSRYYGEFSSRADCNTNDIGGLLRVLDEVYDTLGEVRFELRFFQIVYAKFRVGLAHFSNYRGVF